MANFLKGTCSIVNGTRAVVVDGALNASFVTESSAIFIDGLPPVQGVSGGVGTITLAEDWTETTRNNVPFTVINTIEGLDTAISRSREMATQLETAKVGFDNFQASLPLPVSSGGTGATSGDDALVNLGLNKTAVEVNNALSLAEGTASKSFGEGSATEANKSLYGASGFVNFGAHRVDNDSSPNFKRKNQGLFTYQEVSSPDVVWAKYIHLGAKVDKKGYYKEEYPVVNACGSLLHLQGLNSSSGSHVRIPLSVAPDGLTSSVTGNRYSNLSAARIAGGNSLTASVLNRQDFYFIEVWDELVAGKDFVYPNGDVQYTSSTYKGETLVNNVVAQGYSACNEDDTVTRGYGTQWESASNSTKLLYLSDAKNNLRTTKDGLVQRRFRIRSVKGLEGNWVLTEPDKIVRGTNAPIRFDDQRVVRVQGLSTDNTETTSLWGEGFGDPAMAAIPYEEKDSGIAYALNGSAEAYGSFAILIPLFLLYRTNLGGYHPFHNPNGSKPFYRNDGTANNSHLWSDTLAKTPNNVADCFESGSTNVTGVTNPPFVDTDSNAGVVGKSSGRLVTHFADNPYVDQIKDLRLDVSQKLTGKDFLTFGKRRATTGGAGLFTLDNIPYTTFHVLTLGGYSVQSGNTASSLSFNVNAKTGDLVHIEQNDGSWLTFVNAGTDGNDVTFSPDGRGRDRFEGQKAVIETPSNVYSYYCREIAGDPATINSYMNSFVTANGFYGKWVVGSDFDGTSKTVTLRRVVRVARSSPYTTTGTGWSSSVSHVNGYKTDSNEDTLSYASSRVDIYEYEGLAGYADESELQMVEDLDLVSFITNSSQYKPLSSSVFDQMMSNTTSKHTSNKVIDDFNIDPVTGKVSSEGSPDHTAVGLQNSTSKGIKCLFYSSVDDQGIISYNAMTKELVSNGSNYGDTNTFTINDNTDYITDANGQVVRSKHVTFDLGCKVFVKPNANGEMYVESNLL